MSTAFLVRTTCARIPTGLGQFQLCHFLDTRNKKEHLALVHGNIDAEDAVLTRVHSECFTGDVLGSQRCDCGEQLQTAMRMVAVEGAGVIIYLRQEGRGIGLEQKLRAYNLQDQGFDTVDANLMLGHQADEREYSVAAAILQNMNISAIRLMTNNPDKIEALQALGIEVRARIALEPSIVPDNAAYLSTKVQKMRHMLSLLPTNGASPPTPADVSNGQSPATDNSPLSDTLSVHDKDSVTQQMARLENRIANVEKGESTLPQRPFVTLTYAQTLDGSIAAPDGSQMLISGPEAMRMTHLLRTRHDAILVGIGTVLADNPRLTARLAEGAQPQPVILDTHFRFPDDAALLQHPKGVWLATHLNGNSQSQQRKLQVISRKSAVKIVDLPIDTQGLLDLPALLEQLARFGIRSLMVEGGAGVIRSFLAAQLVDYLIVTTAPRFAGGQHILSMEKSTATETFRASFPVLKDIEYTQVGQDSILWAVPDWSVAVMPPVAAETSAVSPPSTRVNAPA